MASIVEILNGRVGQCRLVEIIRRLERRIILEGGKYVLDLARYL